MRERRTILFNQLFSWANRLLFYFVYKLLKFHKNLRIFPTALFYAAFYLFASFFRKIDFIFNLRGMHCCNTCRVINKKYLLEKYITKIVIQIKFDILRTINVSICSQIVDKIILLFNFFFPPKSRFYV